MTPSTSALRNQNASFKRALLDWYEQHARPLPWRASRDAYRIWVSEIMLQQTTVAAVIPYFERFLDAFPDVSTLACAEEQQVLRLWEGLGYYSRARNLKSAAEAIVRNHHGEFPRDVETLQSLPGIGRYTAGAIASFAYDVSAPIVEANSQRLYARLAGFDDELKTTAGQKFLWQFAEQLVPRQDAGLFNQALMELGSRVCRPLEPLCSSCPVTAHCLAYRSGQQHVIPKMPQRQKITSLAQAYVVIEQRGKLLMQQYATGERWAGLWDFLRIEFDEARTNRFSTLKSIRLGPGLFPLAPLQTGDISWIESSVQATTGLSCRLERTLAIQKQAVTRYRITLICLKASLQAGRLGKDAGYIWKTPEQAATLPLSVMGRKLLDIWSERSAS